MIKEANRNGKVKGIKVSSKLSLTHLLFVDDVILFGLGSYEEWLVFKGILDIFCEASGMSINENKSCFLQKGVDEAILQRIFGIFPYRSDDFRKGFNYLGYFLKPNGYLVKDWLWMVSKFEKKISHWTNRLLSMGGRLVLIRAVLSSIPVYWLSLILIPSSILDKLRKVIFSFLWGSSVKHKKYHLVDWHILARPTSHGGWGIKHLPNFSFFFRMKSF